ncbi:MAG: LptF/LptG family permease [Treponema sp.]|nr:LptF/LptG family permease [Treponema sp.]
MKLVLYLLRHFFAVFFGALAFFVLILLLTDLLMNLWNYISKEVQSEQVVQILLYYIPKTVWYAVPVAVLFATAYTLSDLYAKNELLAVFASGVSLFKFTVPLLVVSVFMSVGLFLFEDNFVNPYYAKKQALQQKVLQKEQSLNNDKIVVMADEGNVIYKADYFDNGLERLYNMFVIFRTPEHELVAVLRAESAIWVDGRWKLSSGMQYQLNDDEVVTGPPEAELLARLDEPPETFRNNTISVEGVNTREARAYIAHLQKAGLPSAEARSLYYKKYAFPFVVFIVVFLAIGLSGKTRKNVLLISLASSIAATVLFYIMQMVTMLMAKFETIPPLMGAWFPVIFFIFLSIMLLKYART